MKPNTHYEEYLITNGTIQWAKTDTEAHEVAMALGCTGSLTVETEIKEVVKTCEGTPSKTWPKPVKMSGTFVGHVPVEVARRAFGLKTDDLVKGVYAYGENSIGGSGIFTWETLNIDETEKKFLAFPNGSFAGGLKISIENGGDEIAQVEMPINFMKDKNREFYYEAFESDLGDENVKEKWLKEFNLELIEKKNTSDPEAKNKQLTNTDQVNDKKDK